MTHRRNPVRHALTACALMAVAASASAQPAGDLARNPLPAMVTSSLEESIRSQLLNPASAEIKIMVHFPAGRGENGRICGEVIEPGQEGARIRTFYSTYTRAGRVLTRFEDMPFAAFLERDTVFRNCGPRL
ncbi:MAG: hypothetical protein ACK4MV_00195 [Beijerinckiaceae bacterium]